MKMEEKMNCYLKRKFLLLSLIFCFCLINVSASTINCNISQESNKISIIPTDSLGRIVNIYNISVDVSNYSYYFDMPDSYTIENFENIEKNLTIRLFFNDEFRDCNFSYSKYNDSEKIFEGLPAIIEDNFILIIIVTFFVIILIICFIIVSVIIADMRK